MKFSILILIVYGLCSAAVYSQDEQKQKLQNVAQAIAKLEYTHIWVAGSSDCTINLNDGNSIHLVGPIARLTFDAMSHDAQAASDQKRKH